MVDQDLLETCLISNYRITRGERVVSLKNIAQANDCRDALAKSLYERLFGWIVRLINNLLQPINSDNDDDDDYDYYLKKIKQNNIQLISISILDMSGFENFRHNSFEQLCINVANEHLQFYFNQHIFLQEEYEYTLEEIEFKSIEFQNNEDIIEVFMGPLGLFALLDEESKFPRATDCSLIQKFHSNFKYTQRYVRSRGNDASFAINHYAGRVMYNADGFLEKNRDNLSSNLIDCMKMSKIQLISDLFAAELTKTGSLSRSNSTINNQLSSTLTKSKYVQFNKSFKAIKQHDQPKSLKKSMYSSIYIINFSRF